MKIKKSILPALIASMVLGVSSLACATGTVTGEIGVSLTIGDSCTISNNDATGATNNWGTMDFGTYGDLSNNIDGTVFGNASSAISVTCSTGLSPTFTVGGGSNDANSVRGLVNGSTRIPYHLYSDSARSSEIAINQAITLVADGTAKSIPIYGRINRADQTVLAPDAGTYTDTVVATIAW
ncbi:spore coat protein U domain-containing protein [Affinibrenneria salicis]|uniref:Spore coat protein U domain-containing protein n=1 Tax=Affinibrenneria salicis TaxID=2590031 RepID=A0A5J5FU22_9GAMM|nr:spore coat U domain-containing protein [Affinibrenneria salicis]KAA8996954.1 spore coat protein U domain-containing protein [Affinibrenneria salicis]